MRNLKQALNHGLIFKQVSRVFKFNQNALLATDVNGSTDLRKKAKNDFEKEFFKLMNNGVFGKTMKKCEKTQRYKTCRKGKKKKLFGVRTKLSYYKVF